MCRTCFAHGMVPRESRSMKILYATYPMAFHTPGGGEMQLMAYREHLPAHGVDVRLFDPWAPKFLAHDLMHFFSCVGGSVHLCRFAKGIGLPLVISSSLWITPQTRHLYPTEEIRLQLALADRVVTNSQAESNMLAEVLGLPAERFSVVYNGIADLFLQVASPDLFRERFGIRGPFVLNVANLEPRKNQLSLARAMKALPKHQLVLVGHRRDPEYASQVLREGAGQVIHVGALAHDELLLSAYRACDLFCLPSTLETPGLAALEAAAQGARLLLTSEGCCAEYFGARASYVDPAAPPESLAAGMRLALKRNRGQTASFDPARFLWRNTVVDLKAVYADVLASLGRSPQGGDGGLRGLGGAGRGRA